MGRGPRLLGRRRRNDHHLLQPGGDGAIGINTGYSHYWTDNWRSNVALGFDRTSRPNAAGDWGDAGLSTAAGNALATLERNHYSAETNLMWTPIAGTQLGLEYEWYHRTVWSGAHGSSNRIRAQALFAF